MANHKVRQGTPLQPHRKGGIMAIYHLTTKHISRKTGRTATAAAAYRAAAVIHDERTGETHDYRNKRGVIDTMCVYDTGDNTHEFLDREQVWNAAELAEKRKDARTAREIVVAIPAELSEYDRRLVGNSFGLWLSKRFGVVADIAIHEPNKDGDERNYHAHIMITTRKAKLENGKVILGDKSDLELSDRELRKRYGADASGRKFINEIRKQWADGVNNVLEKKGIDARIDHRSHAARGLQELPSIKMGVAATAMERRGEVSDRGEINRAIKAANAQYRETKHELEQVQAQENDRITQQIANTDRDIDGADQNIAGTKQRIDEVKRDIERRKQQSASTDFNAETTRSIAAHGDQRDQTRIEQDASGFGLVQDGRETHGQGTVGDDSAEQFIDRTKQHIETAAQFIDRTKQFVDEFHARAREATRDIAQLSALNQRQVQPVAPKPRRVVLPVTSSYLKDYQAPTVAIGFYDGAQGFQSNAVRLREFEFDLDTHEIISENVTKAYPERTRQEFLDKMQMHAIAFLGIENDRDVKPLGVDGYANYIKSAHGAELNIPDQYHGGITAAINAEIQRPQQTHQDHENTYDYGR